jgi:hypothetical protein
MIKLKKYQFKKEKKINQANHIKPSKLVLKCYLLNPGLEMNQETYFLTI